MKLSPESPELTAYLLGELDPARRTEVEAELRTSPELQAELESLRQTSELLARELAVESAVQLLPNQRSELLQSFEQTAEPVPVTPAAGPSLPSHKRLPWLELLLAVRRHWIWAGAGLAALALTLLPWRQATLRPVAVGDLALRYQNTPDPAAAKAPTAPATERLPESTVVLAPLTDNALAPKKSKTRAEVSERGVTSLGTAASQVGQVERTMVAEQTREEVLSRRLAAADAPAQSFYRMDPSLARRYGLAPMNPAPASAGSTLSESVDNKRGLPEVRMKESSDLFTAATPRLQEAESLQLQMRLGRAAAMAPGSESYAAIADNPFKDALSTPLSTFGLDVDTASYSNVRRFLRDGSMPPPDAVRIEELVNYFHYDYPAPNRGEPFGVSVEIAESPWKEGNKLVRIGLQAKSVDRRERPPANLVFLLDVSGSMEPENKLPLVKRSLRLLLDRLGERDSVGIVTYAGESRVALEPTTVSAEGRARILQVVDGLRAGSGTAGGAGIVDAYRLATNRFNPEQVNRVLLCTDGDFNIGITDPAELQHLIEDKAKSGVFLSVLGYGLGNLKDSTMERLADKGNGNYAYIDSFTEARKVLSEQIDGTLVTVAKDTKVQVEFNPARVRAYRLLGYENRALRDRDFNDDTKDAGDVGAGHQVTVLYEIEPSTPNLAGVDPLRYQARPEATAPEGRLNKAHGDELLNLRLRYKEPAASQSRLFEMAVKDSDRNLTQATADFKFSAAIAGYGMMLRQSPHRGDLTWERILRLAEEGLGPDREGYRAEFVDLVRRAQSLAPGVLEAGQSSDPRSLKN